MKSLCRSLDQIQGHYTVVVIGSGYGGGVAASRLARAGQAVCVLERGREFLAGDFPSSLIQVTRETQFQTEERRLGSETGLYDFHLDADISVLHASGLGGTSLINAGVVIEADERVFQTAVWPVAIRHDFNTGGIKKFYTLAKTMLGAAPYPEGTAGYPPLIKNQTHKISAFDIEDGPYYRLVDIAVNFTKYPDGVNHVGMEQTPCNNCGDCTTGCNYTSKNTVQMTYLADAYNHGAAIFTETKVQYLTKKDGKWLVYFEVLGKGRELFNTNTGDPFIIADMVVLSAGTLGSTEILLNSKKHGLPISSTLGTRFSGNGDALGFAYNTDHEVNGIGFGLGDRAPKPVGPCITSIIDTRRSRSSRDYRDGMSLEEGALPSPLAPVLPALFFAASTFLHPQINSLSQTRRIAESIALGPYRGATRNMQCYLVMAHDDAGGKLVLSENGRLRIKWSGVADQAVFKKIDGKLRKMSEALRGQYLPNPIWTTLEWYKNFFGNRVITVHPLGGCPMGEDVTRGVVNHRGQVFSGESNAVHEGLYVADGSVIPMSLGTNPLLTISAIAERNMALLAAEKGWHINYDLPSRPRYQVPVKPPGLEFTETMSGYFSIGESPDYETAEKKGEVSNTTFTFLLTIVSNDIEKMLSEAHHEAGLAGTVEASVLSTQAMSVEKGVFNLFITDFDHVNNRRMCYRMVLNAVEGKKYYVDGFKCIQGRNGISNIWRDTTTLYIDIYEWTNVQGKLIGQGVLHLSVEDFAKQLTTITVTNTSSELRKAQYVAQFGKFFAGSLYETYGSIYAGLSYFDPKALPRIRRPLKVPVPQIHYFSTKDGVLLKLTRYQAGNKGPVLLSHGLGVSSRIFTVDTIETNLLEYLCAQGYDVSLLDYRASVDLPASRTQFTADDIAKYDYPAAIETLITLTDAPNIQVVAHCFGAVTFTMSLLGGFVQQGRVRSAVLSQVSAHFIQPLATQVKAGLYLPGFLELLSVKSLDAYADANTSWLLKLSDHALQLFNTNRDEKCDNPVCQRINLMYGQLYQHDQLNKATHEIIHELFGEANISAFKHLALMCREKHVATSEGRDSYTLHFERMAMPITLISGEENRCFLPASTEETYKQLCRRNASGNYTRITIPGYGHIDCIFGRDAAKAVYPSILKQLELTPLHDHHTMPTPARSSSLADSSSAPSHPIARSIVSLSGIFASPSTLISRSELTTTASREPTPYEERREEAEENRRRDRQSHFRL